MAANSAVTLPFTFNGEEFVYGRVRFNVDSMARVEGFDFSVPAKYALMLLSGNDGAWRFLEAVAKTPLLNRVRQKLLEQASLEGLTSAWKTLSVYIKDAPDGSPRFYRSEYSNHVMDLVDGLTGVSLFCNDLEGVISKLPLNVYCETKGVPRFRLNPNFYVQASAQIEDFFKFVCKVARFSRHAAYARSERCMQTYFSNRAEAYRLLAQMERDATWREERDAFWSRLRHEQAVECRRGLLVSCTERTAHYVTEDGQVLELGYDGAELREAAYRVYRNGEPPKCIIEVKEPEELRIVAGVVAKIRPELAVVIAP
jgi:hypothetical protein